MNDQTEIERLKAAHAAEIAKIKSNYRIRRIYGAFGMFVIICWGLISVSGLAFSLLKSDASFGSIVSIGVAALSCAGCAAISIFMSQEASS